MLNVFWNNIVLITKTIKKDPVLWLLPVLLMPIISFVNSNPLILLNSLILNSTNITKFVLIFLKNLLAIIMLSLVLTIILIIIKKVFHKQQEHLLMTVRKYYFVIFASIITILLPLNIIVEIIQRMITVNGLIGYYLKYFLILTKCIFFYYMLCSRVDNEIQIKKPYDTKFKMLFTRRIVFELLIMGLFISVILAPLFYYSTSAMLQATQQNTLSGFLYFITEYPIPKWFDFLNLLFVAFTHTFIFLYISVLYYRKNY